jgi:hypothetical protein
MFSLRKIFRPLSLLRLEAAVMASCCRFLLLAFVLAVKESWLCGVGGCYQRTSKTQSINPAGKWKIECVGVGMLVKP